VSPAERLGDGGDARHGGTRRALDDDDRQAALARGVEFGLRERSAAVLGDDEVDAVAVDERQLARERVGAAAEQQLVVARQRRAGRVDAAHEEPHAADGGEGGEPLTPGGEQGAAAEPRGERRRGGEATDAVPVVAGARRPAGAREAQQRDAGGRAGAGGGGGDALGERVGGVDDRADAVLAQPSRERLRAAEAPDADLAGGQARTGDAPRQGGDHAGAEGVERGGQLAGLGGAAEDEDRRLLVIGIGAGDPEHVTAQAVRALNEADVFFVIEKGPDAADLVALRRAILERFVPDGGYRVVEVPDPPRDRTAAAYGAAVDDWRRRRAEVWEALLRDELGPGGVGAFLVWGDPSLYDSTLDVIERVLARGEVAFHHEVVAGISSVHALTARHRIALNRVGGAVQITTGRRLAGAGWPDGVDDLVVMLDADCSFRHLDPAGVEIFWGAYLGTPDELLVAGPLAEAGPEVARVRARARTRKGWIMDSYLIWRSRPSE
jgi:precorrin-6A synthase